MKKQFKRHHKPVHGWLVLDKPPQLSSAQAVSRVRYLFQASKAGHIGTLDPFATGCLPIAFGEATKTIPFLMDETKGYAWEMTFGQKTDTGDKQGAVVATSEVVPPAAALEQILSEFIGTLWQRPPNFSAIKVEGRPAYKRARAGEIFTLTPRRIQVDSLTLEAVSGRTARLSCICQKGVYIRTLAEDIAERLGAFAHLTALRRTQNGLFFPSDFISLDKVEKIAHSNDQHTYPADAPLEKLLRPLESVLEGLPIIHLDAEKAQRLRFGQLVIIHHNEENQPSCLVLENGKPVGLAQLQNQTLKPIKIFNL